MYQTKYDLKTPAVKTATTGQEHRLERLGVDLSKYKGVQERALFEPIVSKTNRTMSRSLFQSYRDYLIHRVPDPCVMTHILTTRCNYHCGFCSFADSLNVKHNDLTLAEIEKVYQTVGASLNVIIYSGGETTLNRDLPAIIEAAYRFTAVQSVFIISNAWNPHLILDITHRIAQSCPELHLTWSLSIEGPKAMNNAIRCTKAKAWDAWQNTVDALEALKAIRKRFNYKLLDVQLCTVCSPTNAHLLNDWYETVRDELKPDKWNLNLMRRSSQMTGSALPTFDERRASEKLQPFESMYVDISKRLKEDVLAGRLKFLYHTRTQQDGALKSAVDLISQEANRRTIMEQPPQFCCKAGTMGAYISSEGAVSACEEFAHGVQDNKTFGNLRLADYNFQKIWRGNKAAEHRSKVGKAPECRGCTLESQRNYPAILVSFKSLIEADRMALTIRANSRRAQA
jgi:MoaA/NifB/PqqE/SkfB family radical SAM enzyme